MRERERDVKFLAYLKTISAPTPAAQELIARIEADLNRQGDDDLVPLDEVDDDDDGSAGPSGPAAAP